MLMLVLTLASSLETPTVAPKAHEFSVGPKKKNSMFAANLVTRMLWFLRPRWFPWDADAGVILRVSEMTKKVGKVSIQQRLGRATQLTSDTAEHKGISN
jgi:hypothetical protein